jgi:hypothetical protein
MPRSAVAIANEVVRIESVCQWIGVDLPDVSGRSVKVHCPFGVVYHVDHGAESAFRVYPDTNSAYCFACGTAYRPVSLAAQAWDRDGDRQGVALDLLDRVGFRPSSLAEEWTQVSTREPEIDRAALGLALQVFGERVSPRWGEVQFQSPVKEVLGSCMDLLDLVRTREDVELWLPSCKEALRRALGGIEDHG